MLQDDQGFFGKAKDEQVSLCTTKYDQEGMAKEGQGCLRMTGDS